MSTLCRWATGGTRGHICAATGHRASDRFRRAVLAWCGLPGNSQDRLAELTGLDKAALSRLLSGKTKTSAAIPKIAEVTGVATPTPDDEQEIYLEKISRLSPSKQAVVYLLIDQLGQSENDNKPK